MSDLVLKPGREKSLLRRHPWIFSGAVAHLSGKVTPGTTVRVLSSDGRFLAHAAISPTSQIRARVWSFDPSEMIDAAFIHQRVTAAVQRRTSSAGYSRSTAWRLIHGESDGLPGVIADRYADIVVVQLTTCGAEYWRDTLVEALVAATGVKTIYERSDADVRELEGLPPRNGPLLGAAPEAPVEITEYGMPLLVDVAHGHKTGYYLDQRESRHRVGELAAGRDVLNCFCYTGGFSVAALRNGARTVLSVDASFDALELAEQNAELNGVNDARATWMEGDVFQALRQFQRDGRRFDLIILDPPKFAPTAAHAERAARGYKDINLNAFRLLNPGGLLATFSCSSGISADLFQKIVAGAAADAGVDAQIIGQFSQDDDHPVLLSFPEGAYLKGLLLRRS